MKKLILAFVLLLTGVNTAPLWAQNSKYPPLSEYLMSSDAEIALARSAAPNSVSAHATVKILTTSGYTIAAQGDNGSVCMVMRGFSGPTYTPAQFRDLV